MAHVPFLAEETTQTTQTKAYYMVTNNPHTNAEILALNAGLAVKSAIALCDALEGMNKIAAQSGNEFASLHILSLLEEAVSLRTKIKQANRAALFDRVEPIIT
jgi:hypothetical protein